MDKTQTQLRVDEISSILKRQIVEFGDMSEIEEVGFVESVGDGIARVWGLDKVKSGEVVIFANGLQGLVLNLGKDSVGIIILGASESVQSGTFVRRTGRFLEVPVGPGLIGRVLNGLGQPIDEAGPLDIAEYSLVERIPPSVIDRQSVTEPLQTGITVIDSQLPIGKGQRELIIGDRQTGKTTIAIDTFLNQKTWHDQKSQQRVYCIYVGIGQKNSTIAQLVKTLHDHGAMDYTIIVSASASDPAALQYLAPYVGCAIAEYFRDNGMHALIVYDDLSKHAIAYREISLLLRRSPAREAYPGDVFYLHSRLLERAAKLNDALGGGSLTALPIVETQGGDMSSYIPTNVISITDGQIFLETELFFRGVRPAVNIGISVSRIGSACQTKAMRSVTGPLKIEMAQYRELSAFSQFLSDLDESTRRQLNHGAHIERLLVQDRNSPLPLGSQVALLFCGIEGLLDDLPLDRLDEWEEKFLTLFPVRLREIHQWLTSGQPMQAAHNMQLSAFVHDLVEDITCPR